MEQYRRIELGTKLNIIYVRNLQMNDGIAMDEQWAATTALWGDNER